MNIVSLIQRLLGVRKTVETLSNLGINIICVDRSYSRALRKFLEVTEIDAEMILNQLKNAELKVLCKSLDIKSKASLKSSYVSAILLALQESAKSPAKTRKSPRKIDLISGDALINVIGREWCIEFIRASLDESCATMRDAALLKEYFVEFGFTHSHLLAEQNVHQLRRIRDELNFLPDPLNHKYHGRLSLEKEISSRSSLKDPPTFTNLRTRRRRLSRTVNLSYQQQKQSIHSEPPKRAGKPPKESAHIAQTRNHTETSTEEKSIPHRNYRHEKAVFGKHKKRLICPLCGVSVNASNLRSHKEKVHGEKRSPGGQAQWIKVKKGGERKKGKKGKGIRATFVSGGLPSLGKRR